MPNLIDVKPGELFYCPDCVAPYGTAGGMTLACKCERSAGITTNPVPQDIPRPFEPCHYCQARVISCGSRWHTFPCEVCRKTFFPVNEILEMHGRAALPLGRHSIVNGRYRRVVSFAAWGRIDEWGRERLREGWRRHAAAGGSADWTDFGAFLAREHDPRLEGDLFDLAAEVDSGEEDPLMKALREANEMLQRYRSAGS